MRCRNCSASAPTDARACPRCGEPIAQPALAGDRPATRRGAALRTIFSRALVWGAVGAGLGAVAGVMIVVFDAGRSVPILGSLIESRIATIGSILATGLLILVPALMFLEDEGCITSTIVIVLFGGLIFWIGFGVAMVVFPYARGAISAGAVLGAAGVGVGLIVETARYGVSRLLGR